MYIISKLQTCLICIFTVISWQIDHSFPEVKTTGYNTSRAYGTSCLKPGSSVGTTGIVARGIYSMAFYQGSFFDVYIQYICI